MDPSKLSDRDRFIIAGALSCSIALIDALPTSRQPLVDQADMKRLLSMLLSDDEELARIAEEWRRRVAVISP